MKTNNDLPIQFAEPAARMATPTRSLLDPRFKWRDSSKTDVTRTWRKARLLARLQGAAA